MPTDQPVPGQGRTSLYELDYPALERLVKGMGEPSYRARQLWEWLYRHLADDFEDMTSLPRAMRRRLAATHRLHTMVETKCTVSDDGLAEKSLWRLDDGGLVESVLMHYVDPGDADPGGREGADPAAADPADAADTRAQVPSNARAVDVDGVAPPGGRHTLCLSTQLGCAMGCVFCATGRMGLVRDLSAGECVEQAVLAARRLRRAGERLGNIVFMGMGEPLANWEATRATVERVHDPTGLGIGARHITVSTVGLVPGIRRLADLAIPVRLAVSLHAPEDELRQELVPLNPTYPLADILAACRAYQEAGGRRITFEYVLIDGVNDDPALARGLALRLRGLNAHVNLIPLNPVAGSAMGPSPYSVAADFASTLRAAGVPTTLRMRRGIEIQAGCGQLRSTTTAEGGARSVGTARRASRRAARRKATLET